MYQKIELMGHLGYTPTLRKTPSGRSVIKVSVATNRQYKSGNETIRAVCWFKVHLWGELAERFAEFAAKGRFVWIEGRMQPDEVTGHPKVFETANGHRAYFDVTALGFRFLDDKRTDRQPAAQTAQDGYKDFLEDLETVSKLASENPFEKRVYPMDDKITHPINPQSKIDFMREHDLEDAD